MPAGWSANGAGWPGISPAFRIADEAERWLHLEAVLASLRPRTLWNPVRPHDLVDSILDVIGKAKQELVTPGRYAEWAAQALADTDDPAQRALLERHEEIAAVYAALDERYMRSAVLDHDDTILRAEQLLREHDAPRRAVCDAIEYVMVDEYQDTNYAQARLVETLVASHHNILVVADDDQAIYKFRGASLANLDRFSRTYPGTRGSALTHNYRSTPAIVAAATAIIAIANPTSRIAKTLVAERPAGDPVELWEAADERSEVLGVASECRRLIDAGVRAADIAWLFRRHADMRAAIGALREVGVPTRCRVDAASSPSRRSRTCCPCSARPRIPRTRRRCCAACSCRRGRSATAAGSRWCSCVARTTPRCSRCSGAPVRRTSTSTTLAGRPAASTTSRRCTR